MYNRKSLADDKTHKPSNGTPSKGIKGGKRRVSFAPLSPLEYFISICILLSGCVFTVMQGIFLYQLHLFEQEEHTIVVPAIMRNSEMTTASVTNYGDISNRQMIQKMANETKRQFTPWPPLDAIVDRKTNAIVGDPQFLLDFAMIGFEKSGIHTLRLMASGHKECHVGENHKLFVGKPEGLVANMYDIQTGVDLKRGYFNIQDIYQPCSLQSIHTYFPTTKLIIAVRHPVRFFESIYNARVQNLHNPNEKIATPQERIRICQPHDNSACTDHAHLALWLYKLGKTLYMPPADIEDIIKNTHPYESNHTALPTKNKVFLVETSQLVDQDWFRQQEMMRDFQTFLGLEHEFKNGIPPAHPLERSDTQDIRDKRKIDICQSQYNHLRQELMQGARESSIWIRERFIKSKDVFVSQSDYFEQALISWMDDPCDPKTTNKNFDTKTIENEIPFLPTENKAPPSPDQLAQFDLSAGWPKLEEVVDGDNRLVGNPQFLLDFAIIGIEKCGTSTLMQWIGKHPECFCFQQEETSMFVNQPGVLAKRLYHQYPGEERKRGYKNPIDLFQPQSLKNFQQYFPETKLLVTMRHPVLYFESLYNFRIQNLPDPNDEFAPPLERRGTCKTHSQGLCTDHANFALWLWRLGKTVDMPMTELQKHVHDTHSYEANHYTYPSKNKVFLIEMEQFKDQDPSRMELLKEDLRSFLGLSHTFDQELPHYTPGKVWSQESQAIRDSRKIKICDEQYRPLRDELMKGARESSLWIRTYFLASKDVYISSPEFFDQQMRAWMNDPCEDKSHQDPRATSKWPPLSSLVNDDGEIIGDPQFLLDFAIIGIEKCGTSTLMSWLGAHPELQCPQEENYSLVTGQPGQLVQDAYAMAPYDDTFMRGYKNPTDLFFPGTSLKYLDKYFPQTKLLITIRHPVRYFESLHNFRIQNHNQGSWDREHIATAFERIGPCEGQAHDGCTEHAHFGIWLYRLGKTLALPETELQKAFAEAVPLGTQNLGPVKAMLNPVFLTEITQFADKDTNRQLRLKTDLRDFLGLTKDFEGEAPHYKPGKKWTPEIQAVRDSFKIDICKEEFKPVREVLMKNARETSIWIRESFMKSPDVHVSSSEFFEKAMLDWMDDPCDEAAEKIEPLFRKNLGRGTGVSEEIGQKVN